MKHSVRYHTLDAWLRSRHGEKVQKIPLDAGSSCPNRDGTLALRAGAMNLTAKQSEVRVVEKPKQKKKTASAPGGASLRSAPMPAELDLRGMDTLEAIPVLERYIDSAVMGKLQTVTVIHGKGTGALRAAVQQALKRNKAVKSFRLGRYGEGESGVTVVELK